METTIQTEKQNATPLSEILGDITESAKQLVVEEGRLIKAELDATVKAVGGDLRNLIVFGLLAAMTALPLMMFLIFGIGELVGGRLWLSSLIVTVFWGGGAGLMAYRQYQRILRADTDFSSTRRSLERSTAVVKESAKEVQDAVKQTIQ
jgi:hypothetical protein